MTLPLMAAALVAGCGGEPTDNALTNNAAEPAGNETVDAAANASEPVANLQSGTIEAPVQRETAAPPPPPPAANRIAEPPAAKRPPVPAPQPEPDPHAGHDMDNMANMQH